MGRLAAAASKHPATGRSAVDQASPGVVCEQRDPDAVVESELLQEARDVCLVMLRLAGPGQWLAWGSPCPG
jgi:hypothetical protein